MKQKMKTRARLITVLVILVAIAGYFTFSIAGTSTMSLSQADLESSYGPLDGEQVWVYTFSVGRLGQLLKGRVTPDDVGDEYSGGELPEETFELDVTVDQQYCQYDVHVNQNAEPIYDLFLTDDYLWVGGESRCASYNDCGGGASLGYLWTGGGAGHCYTMCGTKKTGAIGEYDSPDVSSHFIITTEVDGENYEKSFNTVDGSVKGPVGPNTYVVWQGNLDSGKSCPDKDPHTPIYYQGRWRNVDTDAYQRYLNAFDSATTPDSGVSREVLQERVDIANTRASQALNEQTFGTLTRSYSLEDARVRYGVEDLLQIPVITAYIKADWLGIYTPVGEPKIQTVESECFSASSDGAIRAIVSNVGSERGTFTVRAECEAGFVATQNREVSLLPGKSQEVYLPLSADTDKRVEGECTVRAEGTAESDTEKVDVCVDPQNVCQPGIKACDSGNVVQCDQNGAGWGIVENCADGCTVSPEGVVLCKEDPNSGEPGLNPGCHWYDLGCQWNRLVAWKNKVVMTWALILGIGTVLLNLVLFRSDKRLKWKKNAVLLSLLAVLLGAAVFTAFLWFWWVGLLALIGVVIVKALLARTGVLK